MADLNKKLDWNENGIFYVDSTCIDCETCRILAGENFGQKMDMSYIQKQPENKLEIINSLKALLSCPTASIGTTQPLPELKEVMKSFPQKMVENIFYCGYHSEKSYGAFSYFIQREGGNVLVDSPRFTNHLVKNLESLGGVKYMFLTHQDDIADHEQFYKHFGCKRIIHEEDKRRVKAEIVLTGEAEFSIEEDLKIIPVPGHTKGSTVLVYDNKYLFSGDHLAFSQNKNHLIAFRNACWYSWDIQKLSMEKLLNYSFLYVLPGHGRSYHTETYDSMKIELMKCINWMKLY